MLLTLGMHKCSSNFNNNGISGVRVQGMQPSQGDTPGRVNTPPVGAATVASVLSHKYGKVCTSTQRLQKPPVQVQRCLSPSKLGHLFPQVLRCMYAIFPYQHMCATPLAQVQRELGTSALRLEVSKGVLCMCEISDIHAMPLETSGLSAKVTVSLRTVAGGSQRHIFLYSPKYMTLQRGRGEVMTHQGYSNWLCIQCITDQ